MKYSLVIVIFVFLVACTPGAFPFLATPAPKLSPVERYLEGVSDRFESLGSTTRTTEQQLAALAKDQNLFKDKSWRDTLTRALLLMRKDYRIIAETLPPPAAQEYHAIILQAEVHSDRAAELLLAWLDDRDDAKYRQALLEFEIAERGVNGAQPILDALLKK